MPNFPNAKPSHHLTFEGNWPTCVVFLDDDRLVAGDRDGRLFLWDLTQSEAEPNPQLKDREANIHPVRQLEGHTNGISRLVLANEGKRLISASLDHSIRLWDTTAPSSGEAEAVLDLTQRRSRIRRDRSNEEEVLSEPGITVETQSATHVLTAHADWVQGCDISADGKRLITGDDAGMVVVWDLPSRRETIRWRGHKMDGIVSTAISPDGTRGFVAEHRMSRGSFDRPPAQAKIYSLDDGTVLVDLLEVKFPTVKNRDNSYGYAQTWKKWVGHGFVTSAFSPDGRILAVGQGGEIGNAVVHLIDADTGKEIRSVSKHQYGVCDLCFTPDGTHLLTGGRDTMLKVIKVADGKEVATLGKARGGQFKDWFHGVAISPSQTRIAAADIAGIVHIWQVPE